MIRNHRAALLLLPLLWALASVAQDVSGPADNVQPTLNLLRRHTPSYTPGEPVEITLVIEGGGIENIRALGVEEILPSGWRLVAVQGYEGAPPQLYPEPGTEASLEFAWITPPRLPCVFSYTVTVPETEWGEKELYGALLYRLDAGPLQTPPTITALYGPEPEPPELVLRGDNPMELQEGDTWVDPGCTALDHDKQDISAYLTISGNVDTSRQGTYTIEYRVTSQTTGLSASATRIVTVVAARDPENSADSKPAGNAPPLRDFSLPGQDSPEYPVLPPPGADIHQEKPETSEASPPMAFPDLSAYQPVPLERPEENTTTPVQTAKKEAGSREEEIVRNTLYTNRTGETKNNAVQENTGILMVHRGNAPGPLETSYTGRLKPRHWIAGIAMLIVLLVGLPLVWYAAYGGPHSRTSSHKRERH